MIPGGCKHCGGTAGTATIPEEPQAHALCHFLAKRGAPTPSLGDVCPCCKGSGCHPRSAFGPINPNQDMVERWAPACVTCKGSWSVNVKSPCLVRGERKRLHWATKCQVKP